MHINLDGTLFLLVAKPAQTKKKALLQQLGGFFCTELTKAFGPKPETPEQLRQRFSAELKWFTDMIDAFRPA